MILFADCADAQSDQGLRCPHKPEDRFRRARPNWESMQDKYMQCLKT